VNPKLARTLLLVAATVLSLSAMECALRLSRYGSLEALSGEHVVRGPHPTRGWTLIPDGDAYQRSRDYAIRVRINGQGLRDRPHAYEPAPGVFRIVVLGDSFMEAYQVELEESLPFLLQERLAARRVESVNLGIGGYGTVQQVLYLQEEGLRYRPDLVLLAFFTGNDIQDNSELLQRELFGADDEKTYARPYAHARRLEAPLEWKPPQYERVLEEAERTRRKRETLSNRVFRFVQPLVLANLVGQAYARTAARFGAPPAPPAAHFGWPFLEGYRSEVWDQAWLDTRRLMLEGQRLAQHAGASFVIAVVPAKVQVDAGFRELTRAQYPGVTFDETRVNRALSSFCREHGIPLFDPTAAFARTIEAGEPLYHQLEDHHWNARGHALATEELIRFLDAQGLLPAAPPAGPAGDPS
jgi:hypothetical protein